jgi:hypothetical protein
MQPFKAFRRAKLARWPNCFVNSNHIPEPVTLKHLYLKDVVPSMHTWDILGKASDIATTKINNKSGRDRKQKEMVAGISELFARVYPRVGNFQVVGLYGVCVFVASFKPVCQYLLHFKRSTALGSV